MTSDPLSDVLASVRLTGAVFFCVEGAPPWVAEAPAADEIAGRVLPSVEHVLQFHVVTRGRCVGGVAGDAPIDLQAGDVICFPHGDANVMSSAPGLRGDRVDLSFYERRPDVPLPFAVRLGAGATETHLVCGFLGWDVRPFNPLLATLPRVLRARDPEPASGGWLSRFVEAVDGEVRHPRPGGDAVLARLAELMFVEVIRRHLETLPPDRGGWLAGLRDPHVGRALAALHARPGEGWTIDALGREAGLSRSALAERFTILVGEPPMQYLARWRMQVAAGLLASTHEGVAAIGARVGYASEAAFNRAFKKLVGVPPATWRRPRLARARRPRALKRSAAPGLRRRLP